LRLKKDTGNIKKTKLQDTNLLVSSGLGEVAPLSLGLKEEMVVVVKWICTKLVHGINNNGIFDRTQDKLTLMRAVALYFNDRDETVFCVQSPDLRVEDSTESLLSFSDLVDLINHNLIDLRHLRSI
jgi:hypothetical protein